VANPLPHDGMIVRDEDANDRGRGSLARQHDSTERGR
jgi:hypothetical protein